VFSVNSNNSSHCSFDKWDLPLKTKGIEQPESIEKERSKRQQWSQNNLNLSLTGDPLVH
jgi:hypothetical protein